MVRWVVGSIAHGGPMELYHNNSRGKLDGAYKISLAAYRKRIANLVAAAGFSSLSLSGPLPHV